MKRLNLLLLVLVVVTFVSTSALAQKAGVIGTVHNITSQGCQSCHAPHNGSEATGGTDYSSGQVLLWDRLFSTQTFGTYSSNTMGNPATEVGYTPVVANDVRNYSLLCMSCHDGVTTPTLIDGSVAAELPYAVGYGTATTGSYGLRNDHPVNMSHDPTQDSGLAAPGTVTGAGLKLYGAGDTVQCASCHDAHNNSITPFLRVTNAASALCLTCHL